MYFLAFFLISFLSVLFSGILYFTGIIRLTDIPYTYYIPMFATLFSIVFKVKFKSIRYFKFWALRLFVKLNKAYSKVDPKNYLINNVELTPTQEKAIKLWKNCISNKKSILLPSIKSFERQVENEDVLIILAPFTPQESIMTIYDLRNNRHNLYEIHIPEKYLDDVCVYFDTEVQRRITTVQSIKQKVIQDDLDNLLSTQVKSLV